MPSGVPRLDIGLDLLEKVGVRPLLGSEALGTERPHLAVEALNVNRPRLMVLDDDFSRNDDGGDIRAHGAAPFDTGQLRICVSGSLTGRVSSKAKGRRE